MVQISSSRWPGFVNAQFSNMVVWVMAASSWTDSCCWRFANGGRENGFKMVIVIVTDGLLLNISKWWQEFGIRIKGTQPFQGRSYIWLLKSPYVSTITITCLCCSMDLRMGFPRATTLNQVQLINLIPRYERFLWGCKRGREETQLALWGIKKKNSS